jgi:hypothetical protein
MQPNEQSTLRFVNIDFSYVEILLVGGFSWGCLTSSVDRRMGRREWMATWMAWMRYAHETIRIRSQCLNDMGCTLPSVMSPSAMPLPLLYSQNPEERMHLI